MMIAYSNWPNLEISHCCCLWRQSHSANWPQPKSNLSGSRMKLSHNANSGSSEAEPQPYPRSIFFLVGAQFCERFSFYGMQAILVLYFHNMLSYNEEASNSMYHIALMVCHLSSIFGAILADSVFGKFRTILCFLTVYGIGQLILVIASIKGKVALTLLALCIISLGSGGIKPCTSAFGGDQFHGSQSRQLRQFFSVYFITFNTAHFLSTMATPILRKDVHVGICSHRTECYPLAFGVSVVFAVLSIGFMIAGKCITDYTNVPPQKGQISTVFKCIAHQTISDIKAVSRLIVLYLPIPLIWALICQQGSSWIMQANRMNGQVGPYTIKPDQMYAMNPLLVIILIPIFEYLIYPALKRMNLNQPLHRMTLGGLMVGVSFLICGLVQVQIERVGDKRIPILAQLIQHTTIACGEVLFSVTGLEFSYSQAPKSMKTVVQSCFILTPAVGNLIVAVIENLKLFQHQSNEFFFYGALMILDIGIFAILAHYYEPYRPEEVKVETPQLKNINLIKEAFFPSRQKQLKNIDKLEETENSSTREPSVALEFGKSCT